MAIFSWRLVMSAAALTALLSLSGMSVAAAAPTLTLVGPANGSTVTGDSVTVEVQVSGVTLRPPDGQVDPAYGHLHFFLDQQPPLSPGAVVPVGPAHIVHTAETSVTFRNLAPGQHTVWVALGLGTHQLTTPVVFVSTTFTIAAAAPPTRAPAAQPVATAPPPARPAATAVVRPAAAGPVATAAPVAAGLPRTGAGGMAEGMMPAWWTLYSGLIVLLVAFGLRGLARRR